MKTNYREFKRKGMQYSYLLDSIQSDDVDVTVMTDSERLKFAWSMFNGECFNSDYKRAQGLQYQVESWLCGLCSTVDLAYMNEDIEQVLLSWGIEPNDKNVQQWWHKNAANLIQMWNKEGLI